jgi:hypothetical protein
MEIDFFGFNSNPENKIKNLQNKIKGINFIQTENTNIKNKKIKVIILSIDNDKKVDVLFVNYRLSNNKLFYNWKNNFSNIFLNKIFSLSDKIAYNILKFYYLLLEYNKKKINVDKIDAYEYINYIINGTDLDILEINFNITNTDLLNIFNKYIGSKSRFIKSLDNDSLEYSIDSFYSYDYFIDTYLISKISINNNKKKQFNLKNVDLEKLKGDIKIDFMRGNYYINNKPVKKENLETYLGNINKIYKNYINNFESKNFNNPSFYKKLLYPLFQVIFNKFSFFNSFFQKYQLNNIIFDINQPDDKKKTFKVFNKNNQLLIKVKIFMQVIIINNDEKFLILEIEYELVIDILNNTLNEKLNFKWKSLLEKKIIRSLQNKQNLLVINLDENNEEYNSSHDIIKKYLLYILITDPLFIIVSTQKSTVKLKKGESVSFQHVMKIELEKLDYSYSIKEKKIKNYNNLPSKLLGQSVERLRLYKKNNTIKNTNINNVEIVQKKILLKGSLYLKLNFYEQEHEGHKKYIFLNTKLSESNNKSKNFKYIFELLTTDIEQFQKNNSLRCPTITFDNIWKETDKHIKDILFEKIEKKIIKKFNIKLNYPEIISIRNNEIKKQDYNTIINKITKQKIKKIFEVVLQNKKNEFNKRLKKNNNLIDLFNKGYSIYFLVNIDMNSFKDYFGQKKDFVPDEEFSINKKYGRKSIISQVSNNSNLGINNGGGKNNNINELDDLIDNYLKTKINFIEKRSLISFTNEQKKKIEEYNKTIKSFKTTYKNNMNRFFESICICGEKNNILYISKYNLINSEIL